MSLSSFVRKRWVAAGLLAATFAVSFLVFDRLILLGLRASARRYYASLAAGAGPDPRVVVSGKGAGDILVLGTSRTEKAFDQNLLAARLNMRVIKPAYAGRNPRFNYFFYLRHRKENPAPKAVFYGMDYFMFERESRSSELVFLGGAVDGNALDPAGPENAASPLLSRASWLFRKKPDIDNYFNDRMSSGPGPEDPEEEDPGPVRRGKRGRILRRKGNQADPDPDRTSPWKPRPFEPRPYTAYPGVEGGDLGKLLAALEEDGVAVFLVLIPDYVGTNETNFEQDKFKADVAALARPYRNVAVVDFNRPDRFDLENPMLYNTGGWGKSNCHLNARGKMIFTQRFIPEVRPRLAAAPPAAAGLKSGA